jgi:ThiS family
MRTSEVPGFVVVDLFGPFRAFGKELEFDLDDEVTYEELISRLEGSLGEPFAERARSRNTTFILNNRIVARDRLGAVQIGPGDRVAFALLLGGG